MARRPGEPLLGVGQRCRGFERLRGELARAGSDAADRQAQVLLYRSVNYQADNLTFALLYAFLAVGSLVMAAFALGLMVWRHTLARERETRAG